MLHFTAFCDSVAELRDRDYYFLIGQAHFQNKSLKIDDHILYATRKPKGKESVQENAPSLTLGDYILCSLYFQVLFYYLSLTLALAERAYSLKSAYCSLASLVKVKTSPGKLVACAFLFETDEINLRRHEVSQIMTHANAYEIQDSLSYVRTKHLLSVGLLGLLINA